MAKLIALDDGHGAKTAGKRTPYIRSLGRAIHENEFNAPVVSYLKAELERCGFDVLLVAPTDEDTPLSVRTDRANRANADAYVSVHFNAFDGSFGGSNPSGQSIFVYNGYRNKGAGQLADNAAKYLRQGTSQNWRGIKEANFHVLRETAMDAILSENGFMDNEREALLMINADFQREVAIEHAKGICDYFNVNYVEKPKPKRNSGDLYKVQIGAFSDYDNAEQLANQAKEDGFNVYIANERLYKVQLGAFSDYDNAKELADKAKDHGYNVYIA